jgi:hypothetical protein
MIPHLISINDFQTIQIELVFKGRIFKALEGIKFNFDTKEIGIITINRDDKRFGEYHLRTADSSTLRIVAKYKSGIEFDIWDNNEKYEYIRSNRIINIKQIYTFKSNAHEIKYQYNGYGIMIYKDDIFVGRIKIDNKLLSAHLNYSIQIIEFNSVNFLMSLCSIEILQRYIYRLHETGE